MKTYMKWGFLALLIIGLALLLGDGSAFDVGTALTVAFIPLLRLNTVRPDTTERVARMLFSKDPEERAKAARYINQCSLETSRYLIDLSGKPPEYVTDIGGSVEFSQSESFPTNRPARPAFVTHTTDRLQVDNTWRLLFRTLDYLSTNEEGFDIEDVYDAVSFDEIPKGGQIKLKGVTAERINYKFVNYGGGFQYDVNWVSDNKIWRVANGLAAMQARYQNKLASLAYALVTASGYADQTRDTTGATTLAKDITTINSACEAILNAFYTATNAQGDPVEEELTNPGFYLLYNVYTAGYNERVQNIVSASINAPNDVVGGKQLAFSVMPVASPRVPAGKFFLVLPGMKLIWAVRQNLTIYEDFDPYKLAQAHIGWGRGKMLRGNVNQVRGIPLS